jgi:hypothetical protein
MTTGTVRKVANKAGQGSYALAQQKPIVNRTKVACFSNQSMQAFECTSGLELNAFL